MGACGVRCFRSLLALLLLAAVPATREVAYPPVVPGVELQFPRDEGAHPDFRIEWWYVTGWVQDEAGAPLGFQVTFFRVRPGLGESNPSRFARGRSCSGTRRSRIPRHGRLRHAERSARDGLRSRVRARRARRRAGSTTGRCAQDGDRYRAVVAGDDFSMQLDLERDAAAAAAGRARLQPQGPEAARGQLLLQPAAPARERRDRRSMASGARSPARRGSTTSGRAT